MEVFKKLVDIAYEMERLYIRLEKELDENKKILFRELLEELNEKESYLLEHLTEKEVREISKKLMDDYDCTFDGTFFPKYFLPPKSNMLYMTRVYRNIFLENQFYSLQHLSEISKKEARKFGYNPYISSILKIDDALLNLDEKLQTNYQIISKKSHQAISYISYSKFKEKQNEEENVETLDLESLNDSEKTLFYQRINSDIQSLSREVFSEENNEILSEKIMLLETYLKTLENNRQNVLGMMLTAFNECYEKDIIKDKNLEILNEMLKSLKLEPLNQDSEILAINYTNNTPKTGLFTKAYFIEYENRFWKIYELTKQIWYLSASILESKLNQEPQTNRLEYYKTLEILIAKREKEIHSIKNILGFRSYVNQVYGFRRESSPFFALSYAVVMTDETLESQPKKEEFLIELTVGEILRYTPLDEIDEDFEYGYIQTIEEEYDATILKVKQQDEILKAFVSYVTHCSTEEEFLERLQELGFVTEEDFLEDSELDRIDMLTYYNYQSQLNAFLDNPENNFTKELTYALYIEHILDGNLEELIKNDFNGHYRKNETKISLTSEELEELIMDCESKICNMCDKYPNRTEIYDVVFKIYLESLREIVGDEGIEILKLNYDKNMLLER